MAKPFPLWMAAPPFLFPTRPPHFFFFFPSEQIPRYEQHRPLGWSFRFLFRSMWNFSYLLSCFFFGHERLPPRTRIDLRLIDAFSPLLLDGFPTRLTGRSSAWSLSDLSFFCL